jgi:hypothetical protein
MNDCPTDIKSRYDLLAPVFLDYHWHYLFHGHIQIVDYNLFLNIIIFFIIISNDDESLFVLLASFT